MHVVAVVALLAKLLGEIASSLAQETVCPQRCMGPRALLPGIAPCLTPSQKAEFLGDESATLYSDTWAHIYVHRDSECFLGTYFGDGGACQLRMPTKADILNCHRQEMTDSGKRTRFIILGASEQWNKMIALSDILDPSRTEPTVVPGDWTPGVLTTYFGVGGTYQRASSTLDLIFDSDMNLRYTREGGIFARPAYKALRVRGENVKEIQDAPDFGPGSVRITFVAVRYGVDLESGLRMALGLSAIPTPVYNPLDFAHPDSLINDYLNNYSAHGGLPPEGTAHYNWTAEDSAIIHVNVALREPSFLGTNYPRRHGPISEISGVELERENYRYIRWWLHSTTTPEVRSWAPLRSVVFSDLYPSEPGEHNDLSRTIEDTVMDIKAARTRNELPYVDFQPQRALGNAFDQMHNYALLFGRHIMKPWLVWYLAQWMGAVCSTEGDHISECGTVAWYTSECHRIGNSWRDNARRMCQVGTSDLSFTLPPGTSATINMNGTNGTNSTNGTQVGGGSTLTQDIIDGLMSDLVSDQLAETNRSTASSGEWEEQICTTCEYYLSRMAREQSNATGGGKCSCVGFQAHSDGFEGVGVNGSNITNGSTNDLCRLHIVHSVDWLPFTKVCDSPNVPEHIWWYAILLLLVVAYYGTPRCNDGKKLTDDKQIDIQQARRIDTSSLTGLRGFAAMHVALGHHTSKVSLSTFASGLGENAPPSLQRS